MPARIAANPPLVVLIAVPREQSETIAGVLNRNGYVVVQAPTGGVALGRAPEIRLDLIILGLDLPDMSGIDACRSLRSDQRIGRNVPILILAPERPTPEQRVTALRAGAWDFLLHPGDADKLSLRVQTYVQAKRNIDDAFADDLVDPTTGLHSRPGLARWARELGALMSRHHGALACVVFALDADPVDRKAGRLVARTARLSDVVGALGPTEFAVLAPATDHVGAVKLAERVASALFPVAGGSTLRAGYDAVANLTYSPIDPVELLARATAAVQRGRPEPTHPWVRRYDAEITPEQDVGARVRITPTGLVLETGRTRS
ncbi:MAG TPA: response regulator [Gemmatimonadales bacterium]|nr:response regulator [Gemmatimonadales bacterium]